MHIASRAVLTADPMVAVALKLSLCMLFMCEPQSACGTVASFLLGSRVMLLNGLVIRPE